jgi:hypothetical protein
MIKRRRHPFSFWNNQGYVSSFISVKFVLQCHEQEKMQSGVGMSKIVYACWRLKKADEYVH